MAWLAGARVVILYQVLAAFDLNGAPCGVLTVPTDQNTVGIYYLTLVDAQAAAKKYMERSGFRCVTIVSFDAKTESTLP